MSRPEDRDDLTKLIVNLVPSAMTALQEAVAISEMTRTDTVNRALQLYAYLVKSMAKGATVHLRYPNGEIVTISMDWGGVGDAED